MSSEVQKPTGVILRDTSLKKLGFDHLDKLITIDVIKKTICKSMTKKDFCLFASHNSRCKAVLKKYDSAVTEANEKIIEGLIEDLALLDTELAKFKNELKEIKRKKAVEEAKLKEEEIFQRILQEKLKEKSKEDLEKEYGIPIEKLGAPDPPKNKLVFSKKADKEEEEESQPPPTSTVLDLGTFYAFFQQVVKRDLIHIKDMNGNRLVVDYLDLELDNEPEVIKMRVRQALI